jgi:hypothetical protein
MFILQLKFSLILGRENNSVGGSQDALLCGLSSKVEIEPMGPWLLRSQLSCNYPLPLRVLVLSWLINS